MSRSIVCHIERRRIMARVLQQTEKGQRGGRREGRGLAQQDFGLRVAECIAVRFLGMRCAHACGPSPNADTKVESARICTRDDACAHGDECRSGSAARCFSSARCQGFLHTRAKNPPEWHEVRLSVEYPMQSSAGVSEMTAVMSQRLTKLSGRTQHRRQIDCPRGNFRGAKRDYAYR